MSTEQSRGHKYIEENGCDCSMRADQSEFPTTDPAKKEQHLQSLENPKNHAFDCAYRRPRAGHRVRTKRRVIEAVAHEDSGLIQRLEDGGYCVVKWDSDGESTSVFMASLRHELPHEGLERAHTEANTIFETTLYLKERERLAQLSDLQLFQEIMNATDEVFELGDDPRVLELMERLHPELFKAPELPTEPRFISIALPINVARDITIKLLTPNSPGSFPYEDLYAATKAALYRATKDEIYNR